MKRHHFTSLCAIAVLLIGIVVVVIRADRAEEVAHSHEELQALQQRQVERFLQAKHDRLSRPMRTGAGLSSLKESLLNEFPELRPKPLIPNKENPIYLLNELANELLDDGQSLREEIHEVMGKGDKWNAGEMKALVERYAHVLERLDEIAVMPKGSYAFEGDDITKHPDAMMLFLDLIRLRSQSLISSGVHEGLGESLISGVRLSQLIKGSEGASVMHSLMAEAFIGNPHDGGLNQEIYDFISGPGAYGAGLQGMFLPDWGTEMSRDSRSGDQELLINVIRGMWDNQLSEASLERDPNWGEAAVARAYSAGLEAMITGLRETPLHEFIRQEIPTTPVGQLTSVQHELITRHVKETHDTIREISEHATLQNLTAAAHILRSSEQMGESLHEVDMHRLPMHPVTGKPFRYNPETRMLTTQGTTENGTTMGYRLHPPEEGSLLDHGTVVFDYE